MKKEKSFIPVLTLVIFGLSVVESALMEMTLEGCLILLPMLLLQLGKGQWKLDLSDFMLMSLFILGVRYTLMAEAATFFAPIVLFSAAILAALKLGAGNEFIAAVHGIYMTGALYIFYLALLGLSLPRFAAPLGAGITAVAAKELVCQLSAYHGRTRIRE